MKTLKFMAIAISLFAAASLNAYRAVCHCPNDVYVVSATGADTGATWGNKNYCYKVCPGSTGEYKGTINDNQLTNLL